MPATYRFKLNNGNYYTQDKFNNFIIQEIRPILSSQGGTSTITMEKTKDNTTTRARLTIRHTDLYIIQFNGNNIPNNMINYNDSQLKINAQTIETAYEDVRGFTGQATNETENSVKVMAFLFAEATRFAIVNYVAWKILKSLKDFKWRDFRDIIRNWQVLSQHATANHLEPPDVRRSGNKILPIEPEVINSYNSQPNIVKLKIPSGAGM